MTFACSTCAAEGEAESGDDSPLARRVEPVIDAWFDSGSMPAAQVGYPTRRARPRRSPSRPTSSPRPSTRPGAGSIRCWRSTRWCSARAPTATSCASATSSTPTGARCPSRSATSSTRGRSSTPEAPTPCAGGCSARARRGRRPGPRWAPSTPPCATCCSRCGTRSASSPRYASLNGFDPADPAIPAPASRGRSTAGSCPGWPARRRRSPRRCGRTSPSPRPLRSVDLVDDLSNWYVRRSRRRFWRTDPDAPAGDTLAAQATLHTRADHAVAAAGPLCPFVADRLWRHLTGAGRGATRCTWPTGRSPDAAHDRSPDLEAQMALARRLTSLGRAARSEAGSRCASHWPGPWCSSRPDRPEILRDIVADELNVDEIDSGRRARARCSPSSWCRTSGPSGPRLGERGQGAAAGAGRARRAAAAAALEAGGAVTVTLAGRTVELAPARTCAPGPGSGGLCRVARRRRGGGARPGARRRAAPAGPGPRGGPPGPGPAQDERPGGVRPHPPLTWSASTRCRIAIRHHRPRGAGRRDRERARRSGEGTPLDLDDELVSGPAMVWMEKVAPPD